MNNSCLYEKTFYGRFIQDLLNCQNEVIFESPFITSSLMKTLYPTFEQLVNRGVKVSVVIRDSYNHSEPYEAQSENEIRRFERLGVQVLLCIGNHHRKLAILDRKVLWEGSLNILAQTRSREIMRRLDSKEITMEMFNFLQFEKYI